MLKKNKNILFSAFLFVCVFSISFIFGGAALNAKKTTHAESCKIPDDYGYSGANWSDPAVVYYGADVINDYVDTRADGKTQMTYGGSTYTAARESYKPCDRQWQGLVSVAVVNSRVWACWYTGGKKEPDPFNYVVMAYSDDDGKTWVDPYLIIDHPDVDDQNIMLVVPNLFVDEDGDLWLFYLQSSFWGIKFNNAGANNIADLTWEKPKVIASFKTNQPPTLVINENGKSEWICASENEVGNSHVESTWIYASTDKGAHWEIKAKVNSSAASARRWPESQVVQTSGGNMILASRLEKGTAGGVETARSTDYGYTWTSYTINNDEPFIGPGSKFFMLKLSDGKILVVNNDSTSERRDIAAYLSEDGGVTWKRLLLDGRTDVSYPSAFEKNGKIYVAWDKGRYIEKEIRLSVVSRSDFSTGIIMDENSLSKLIISKPTDYKDIVSFGDAFSPRLSYPTGTTSSAIKEALPKTITVTDESGCEHILTGEWNSAGYKQSKAGHYLFRFVPQALPEKVSDGADILKVIVTLSDNTQSSKIEEQRNCNGSIGGSDCTALSISIIMLIKKLFKKKT